MLSSITFHSKGGCSSKVEMNRACIFPVELSYTCFATNYRCVGRFSDAIGLAVVYLWRQKRQYRRSLSSECDSSVGCMCTLWFLRPVWRGGERISSSWQHCFHSHFRWLGGLSAAADIVFGARAAIATGASAFPLPLLPRRVVRTCIKARTRTFWSFRGTSARSHTFMHFEWQL